MDKTLEKIYGIGKENLDEYRKHLMIGGGTPGPVLVRGKGVRVQDIDGKSYIDCTSQSWALYLGYCHDEILQIISEHSQNLTHVHQGFDTLPRFYLAKKLSDIAPGNLNRVSFTVGGGPAIESAMKISIKNRPGSAEFLCLYDGYHGTTLGSMGASWVSTKASGKFIGGSKFLSLIKQFIRVPNPYCYRCWFDLTPENCNLMCAKILRHTLDRGVNGPAAGIIIEPLQASAGQIPCPKKYLEEVRKICDEYGVILIFDEIQTFARMGTMFASHYYGVAPDILVFGKAIGGGLPLSGIIIDDKLEGFNMKDVEELHTFANASLSHVAAIKQLEIIERDNILENVQKIGSYIAGKLREMSIEFPEIGDIRAIGLHIGIEFVENPKTKLPIPEKTVGIRDEAMKKGVIFGLGGVRKNVLKIKPPLIIKKDEADEVLDVLKQSMKEVLRK